MDRLDVGCVAGRCKWGLPRVPQRSRRCPAENETELKVARRRRATEAGLKPCRFERKLGLGSAPCPDSDSCSFGRVSRHSVVVSKPMRDKELDHGPFPKSPSDRNTFGPGTMHLGVPSPRGAPSATSHTNTIISLSITHLALIVGRRRV